VASSTFSRRPLFRPTQAEYFHNCTLFPTTTHQLPTHPYYSALFPKPKRCASNLTRNKARSRPPLSIRQVLPSNPPGNPRPGYYLLRNPIRTDQDEPSEAFFSTTPASDHRRSAPIVLSYYIRYTYSVPDLSFPPTTCWVVKICDSFFLFALPPARNPARVKTRWTYEAARRICETPRPDNKSLRPLSCRPQRAGAPPIMSGPNLPEYRHGRSGSLNIPPSNKAGQQQPIGPTSPPSRFEGPRSPPSMLFWHSRDTGPVCSVGVCRLGPDLGGSPMTGLGLSDCLSYTPGCSCLVVPGLT
jgi:hypothetical protein